MEILKNKLLVKLIASLCVFLTLFNFAMTNAVYAAEDDEEVFGGALLTPIMNLLTGLGDGIMDIIHNAVFNQNETLIRLDGTADSWWSQHGVKALSWIAAIAVVAVIMFTAIPTGGASIAAGGGVLANITGACFVIKTTAVAAGYGLAAGVGVNIVGRYLNSAAMSDDIYLPIFNLTPEEIFANKVWLFDVNFFNPGEDYTVAQDIPSTQEGKFNIAPTSGIAYEFNKIFKDVPNNTNKEEIFEYGTKNPKLFYELWNAEGDRSTLLFSLFTDEDMISLGRSPTDEDIKAKAQEKLNENAAIKEFFEAANQLVKDSQPGSSNSINSSLDIPLEYTVENMIETRVAIMGEYKMSQQNDEKIHQYSYTLVLGGSTGESLDYGNTKLYTGVEFYYNIREPHESTLQSGENYCYHEWGYETPWQLQNGQQVFPQGSKTEKIKITPSHTAQVPKDSIAAQLKGIVSEWYFILRNLAILVLLVLLIYSGIRIVIGSTAGEKAKYKERIMDWLVAMCLVFIMHYIMVFAVELNERFIELIDSVDGENVIIRDIHLTNSNHIDVVTKDDRLSQFLLKDEDLGDVGLTGEKVLGWATNLAGGMRIELQLVNEGTATWIGYVFCYLLLVIYTLIFTWTYLRRVLYMAFLTMIAPLVAMTYPIDKITDGKAQAFNTWLKEYIFNLLIQPFHLLLYIVLVGSAFDLAGQNPIYAVVAIGFMTPAEKLLRNFFGFDKAKTPGLLGGAAGAALAMTGMQKIIGFGRDHGGNNSNKEDSSESDKIKFSSSKGVNAKGVVASSTAIPSGDSGNGDENTEGSEDESGQGSGATAGGKKGTQIPSSIIHTPSQPGYNGMGGGADTSEDTSEDSSVQSINVIPKQKPETDDVSFDGLTRKTSTKGKKGGALRRGIRTIGAGMGAYGRALGQKNYKRINKARPIRSLARGALGLAGATAFGMAGLALGVASGDPTKAFQYTTAGVAGGYSVGKGVAGKTIDAVSVDTKKIQEEMEIEYYGEEYKNFKLQQEKEAITRNEQYINYLRQTLGVSRKEAKNILETTGAESFDSGIRKVEDIATIHQMSEDMVEEEMTEWENVQKSQWETQRAQWNNGQITEWENELRKKKEEEELIAKETKDAEERAKAKAKIEKEQKMLKDKIAKEEAAIKEKIAQEQERRRRQAEIEARQNAIAMKKFSDRTPDLSKLGAKKRESYRSQFETEMRKEFIKRLTSQGMDEKEAISKANDMAYEASNKIINGIIRFDDTKSNILKA